MIGLQLVAQHGRRHRLVCSQRIKPAPYCAEKPVARTQFQPVRCIRGSNHGRFSAVEPRLGQRILVGVALLDIGQGDVHGRRDVAQMHRIPATLLAEFKGGVEDALCEGPIGLHFGDAATVR
jgi:hypothetical protein